MLVFYALLFVSVFSSTVMGATIDKPILREAIEEIDVNKRAKNPYCKEENCPPGKHCPKVPIACVYGPCCF
uniref:Kappa-scoloptoxin(07)-Ssm2b n=1 Tax=Scolopendra mutilans TaxID=2836329 RepID=TX72B_SCOMU|nr:RecName: Full=Kappa-scoloptoxin(07)-Ssm2b; Short=Kappa-SLPTX(07)-Ssm2b; AltName: Full=Kappa-scoloptoxin-Ssm2b; Short=Kappa-SLPTX-Ssm2b; Flags: Precursor [Scolopendra mutilans]AFM55010.1 putative K+ channel inhibitor 1 [Scolopendra subspinipes]